MDPTTEPPQPTTNEVQPHDSETLALSSLTGTVNKISRLVGVDPRKIFDLEKQLPVSIEPGKTVHRGAVGITKVEGHLQARIKFRDAQIMDEANAATKMTRVEEVTHWIHLASNPELAHHALERGYIPTGPKGYYPDSALLDTMGIDNHEQTNVLHTFQRMGLSGPAFSGSAETAAALEYLLKADQLDYVEGLRLYKALSTFPQLKKVLPDPVDVQAGFAEWRQYALLIDGLTYKDYDKDKSFYDYAKADMSYVSGSLFSDLKDAIDQAQEVGVNMSEIAAAAQESGVGLMSLAWKDEATDNFLQNLSPQARVDALIAFATTPLSLDELRTLTLASSEPWKYFYPIRASANPSAEDIAAIKEKIRADLENLKTVGTNPDQDAEVRKTLRGLLRDQRLKATAQATLAADMLLFFDDLPPEGSPQRHHLVTNPRYMEEYKKAMLNSDSGPLASLNIDSNTLIDTDQFTQAVGQLSQDLFVKPQHQDISLFLAQEREKLNGVMSFGTENNYRQNASRQLLRNLVRISDSYTSLFDSELVGRALQLALEEGMQSSQKTKVSSSDIMMEPIAKVMASMAANKNVEAINYQVEGIYLNSYSEMLSAQAGNPEGSLTAWHKNLEKFVQRVRKTQGWSVFTNFLAASSLADQQAVVANYLL